MVLGSWLLALDSNNTIDLIIYLRHIEIDKAKWDECITNSNPGLPYAFSWYLDIVSPGWDGLVLDNYKAIMALPHKRKWFVTYIYKPYFAQQLGLFSPEIPTGAILDDFIRNIPAKYMFIHTNLNESNNIKDNFAPFKNANHLLRIDRDYREICKDYSRNCRRNIKKAYAGGLYIKSDMDIRVFVKFVFENLEQQISRLDKEQSFMLESIIIATQQKKIGHLYGVYSGQHELYAAGFFMQTSDRHVFSVCASSEKGKFYDAMYLLVDDQIKKSAGIKKWFDFSGSNMEGIAYFNRSFGARVVTYPTLHLNRLPFPFKLLKK